MRKYNWKKMALHTQNYDGTCLYCGGHCKEDDVVDMFYRASAELAQLRLTSVCPDLCYRSRRIAYLQRRLRDCYTFRFVD